MDLEDDTTVADSAADDAAFGAGFDDKPLPKTAPKSDDDKTAREKEAPREPVSEPEYAQLTKDEIASFRAAAADVSSLRKQALSAFGSIGNLQTAVNALKAQTPRGGKIEISKEAFAEMEKDFPELANSTRTALEKALAGVTGTGTAEPDDTRFTTLFAQYSTARELESLVDAHPDWRTIVGAVDITKEQPDAENPFRKWLATKDATYQARVNGTESAAVISRAIRLFQNETKTPPKAAVTPRDDARAERIRAAVQPRGDGAGASPGKSDDDEFIAGYNSR